MIRCPDCFVDVANAPAKGPCPNGHVLPAGWTTSPTTAIAMAGARATGKSVYIGILIKQLEQYGEQAGVTIEPASEQVAESYRENYEQPLYVQRGMVKPTTKAGGADSHQRLPLMFTLRDARGGRHHLVIRDVAGEDLEADKMDVDNLTFFRNADAVVFMFDPLRVPEIARSLSEVIPIQRADTDSDPTRARRSDPTNVLRKTLSLCGDRAKIAVVLSKFDAMQALRRVDHPEWRRIMGNAGAAIFRDSGTCGTYDDIDGQLLHEEVRSLLYRLNSRSLTTTLEAASYERGIAYRYFAVSALGEAPDGQALSPRGIAPYRCLDPLRWAFTGSVAL